MRAHPDRERARDTIYDAFEMTRVSLPPAPGSGPSLARHLNEDEMRRAGSPGVALRMIAHALQKLRDGDADAAEALLTRAIELVDALEETWYERALLRAARGEMAPAADDLRVYLERTPRGKRAAEARELWQTWDSGV